MIVFKEAEISGATETASVEKTVRDILDAVRSGGDEAVRNYTEKLTGSGPLHCGLKKKLSGKPTERWPRKRWRPCSLRP